MLIVEGTTYSGVPHKFMSSLHIYFIFFDFIFEKSLSTLRLLYWFKPENDETYSWELISENEPLKPTSLCYNSLHY